MVWDGMGLAGVWCGAMRCIAVRVWVRVRARVRVRVWLGAVYCYEVEIRTAPGQLPGALIDVSISKSACSPLPNWAKKPCGPAGRPAKNASGSSMCLRAISCGSGSAQTPHSVRHIGQLEWLLSHCWMQLLWKTWRFEQGSCLR